MRTLDDITQEYLTNHPEEHADVVRESYVAFQQDGDIRTLASLWTLIARVSSTAFIAAVTGLPRSDIDHMLRTHADRR